VVLNLVAGFQALGTLMAVGLMMLPAAIARLWVKTLPSMMIIAALIAAISGFAGLVISYHWDLASGPTIILIAAFLYCLSLLFCPSGAVRRLFPARI
jgi:zinc/manganese transport system permease protein